MVLSNAERQARYRQRLKDAARFSITPKTVLAVAKRSYELNSDPHDPPWDEWLKRLKRRDTLVDLLDLDPSGGVEEFSEFGELAESAHALAAIVSTIRWPKGRPKV
jgi:hypothetical protein